MSNGTVALSGRVGARLLRAPQASILWKVRNFPSVWPGLWRHALARSLNMNHMLGTLCIRHILAGGKTINYGLVSTKLVTTAFAELMVDQLIAESSVWGDFKYHDSGIGVTPAAIGDTDIETTDGESRATGTQVETSSKVYKSVGTISYTSTKAITEHGIFNTAATATLMDHHVFSALNVENGDSIEFTYELTVSDGG